MVERRSLGVALDMTPEKQAFIQGTAVAAPKVPVQQRVEVPPAAAALDTENVEEDSVQSVRVPRRSRSRRKVRAPLPQGDQALLGITNLWVPLTTRLQPTTAAALKRAGLEQKLHGQMPNTVQEIAEEAIQQWLRDFGYLT